MGNIKQCLQFVNSIPKKHSTKYSEALAIISSNQKYVIDMMNNEHIDGIMLPIAKSGSSTYDLKLVNTWQAAISSNTGLPSIVIQIGPDKNNMPVAMEIVGNKFAESELIGMAYDYEEHYISFTKPQLVVSHQYDNWPLSRLNNLFRQIGKNTYLMFIKPHNKNEVTAEESYRATALAIKDMN